MNNPKYRIGIPTTSGVSWIVGLEVIDPLPVNQVLKQDGFQQLSISPEYHQLCQNALLQLGCRGPFRLTLSEDVESGRSWELPVLLAHVLHAQGALAVHEDESDESILATGAVGTDFRILSERYHLEAKIEAAHNERVSTFFAPKPGLDLDFGSADFSVAHVDSLEDLEKVLSLAAPSRQPKDRLNRFRWGTFRGGLALATIATTTVVALPILGMLLYGAGLLHGIASEKLTDRIVSNIIFSDSDAECFDWSQTGHVQSDSGSTPCGLELSSLSKNLPVFIRLSPQSAAYVHQSLLTSLLEGVSLPATPSALRVPFRYEVENFALELVKEQDMGHVYELILEPAK